MPAGPAALPHLDLSYAVALLLVGFYAASRFRTPASVRSQTSRAQFMLSGAAYIVSCIGVFMLLAFVVGQNAGVVRMLHWGAPDTLGNEIGTLDAALVAALMMTTLLPSFPMLRDVDRGILRFFHRLGSIPIGAQLWALQMKDCFVMPPGADHVMREYIESTSDLPNWLASELRAEKDADPMRFRFTRNLAIYVALSKLAGRVRFADEYHDEMAAFEKRMASYLAQSMSFLTLAAKLSSRERDELGESVDRFKTLNLEAYEDLRLMLARIMLYSSRSESEMIAQLGRMGFALQRPVRVRVPLNLLAVDMLLLVLLFVLATLAWSGTGEISFGKALAIGLLVSVNHAIAAIFALLPKQMWSFADIRCARERPYLAYVLSATLALTISVPVSYGFNLLRLHLASDPHAILAFPAQCKWLLLSTTLAFALAFACDDRLGGETKVLPEPAWLRWLEGAAIAALLGGAGYVAVRWLALDQAALHRGGPVPPLWVPLLLSAAIGAVFGSTIPHWYRRVAKPTAPERMAQRVAADGMAVRAAET